MQSFDSMHRSALFACSATLALALSACASDKPVARDPSAASSAPIAEASGASASSDKDRETTVQISKAFRARCSLPEDTQAAPGFDYDQSTLRARGKNVLDDVAVCLIEGPLKGEVITIIGRADPRGTEQYNQDLAATRAAAARKYLADRGVPADRMRLMTRGEQGARGNDESTWAIDRRVDLELGDLNNSPILEGSMMQKEASKAASDTKGASYSDTAEGGKPVGGSKGGGATPSSGTGSSNP